MAPSTIKRIFPIITASGFSAAVAQIVLLRELMLLFYGIELCMGVILAAWLVWSALGCGPCARFVTRHFPNAVTPELILIVAAMVLPLTLLLIRASNLLWGIVPGEIPPLIKLLQICLGVTFPFSLLSGLLFGLCWGLAKKTATAPLAVYVGEALGAAAGGIAFYLLILCGQSALTILLVTSGAMLLAVAWFFRTGRKGAHRLKMYFFTTAAAVAIAIGFCYNGALDLGSRRIQWGRELVVGKDTPYQNLIMLREKGQSSVFANGLWLFSAPDLLSREYAVHPALLQHPAPQSVLLIGGGPVGLAAEGLRHPSVRHIDIVETDRELADFSRNYLPENLIGPETGGVVTWHYQDATRFLRGQGQRYDVVLMNMGDPINAQMNRFYTAAFFAAVKNRIAPGGLFSFGVSGGGEMLGEIQIQFLGAIYRTLGQIFSDVLVLPGDQARFLAANRGTVLVEDPNVLSERLRKRNLHLSHVREDTLRNTFEGFRLRYFKSVLKDTPTDQINSDAMPLCYAYALELWTSQWHSRLGKIVASITRIPSKILLYVFPLICLFALGIFKAGRFNTGAAVTLSTATVGALTMVLQMVLLIEFQIMAGALFLHLALIVALFMAGMAGGAGWASMRSRSGHGILYAKKRLMKVQAMVCLLPMVLMGLFFLLQGPLQSVTSFMLPELLFPCLSLLSGILGGFHFSTATVTMAELGYPVTGIGGRLYAFDLIGAAGGLFIATFFLIPSLGPLRLLPLLSIAAGSSMAMLYLNRCIR